MDVALLHFVCLKPPEAEPRQVAGARRDAAKGHAGNALDGIGRDEGAALVHVLGQPHVADRGIVGVGQDLQEVMMLSEVLGRVMRHLHGPQRHLRLQEGGAIGLRGRVVQCCHVRLICERPKRHKRTFQGKGTANRDVELRGAGRNEGQLSVNRWI